MRWLLPAGWQVRAGASPRTEGMTMRHRVVERFAPVVRVGRRGRQVIAMSEMLDRYWDLQDELFDAQMQLDDAEVDDDHVAAERAEDWIEAIEAEADEIIAAVEDM